MNGVHDKMLATVAARLALHGWSLHKAIDPDGRSAYVAVRNGCMRELPDLAAAERLADQLDRTTPTGGAA